MVGDPMGRFSRDMAAASRDLNDLSEPQAEAADGLAGVVREEAPVVSGFLRGSVYSDSGGVGVGAVYAGVVNDHNPYAERAVDRYDAAEPFAAYVDQVFDSHLSPIYF